jgi:hypothetical protein
MVLLLTSVRVAPVDGIGNFGPVTDAMAAEAVDGTEATSLPADAAPAVLVNRAAAKSETDRTHRHVETDGEGCTQRIIHVETTEIDGKRVILRIDAAEVGAGLRATTPSQPVRRSESRACKLG